jgi:hypothetical protein
VFTCLTNPVIKAKTKMNITIVFSIQFYSGHSNGGVCDAQIGAQWRRLQMTLLQKICSKIRESSKAGPVCWFALRKHGRRSKATCSLFRLFPERI